VAAYMDDDVAATWMMMWLLRGRGRGCCMDDDVAATWTMTWQVTWQLMTSSSE
jgi:hypothetical protein